MVFIWVSILVAGFASEAIAAPTQTHDGSVPTAGQKTFTSSEAATKALVDAAKAADKTAVHELFGSEATNLLTGDVVQDNQNFQAFALAVTEKCEPERVGEDKFMLDIGTNNWPFPIPLIKRNGLWFFDTSAGMEEVINRHIGRDELHAIGLCRAFGAAQQKYFSDDPEGTGVHQYARKFKSSPEKKDGLYWPVDNGDEKSPLGALADKAHAEGYGSKEGAQQPFHGYLFKILTRQGRNAPGGASNYVVHGRLTAGYALVAYPAEWNQSGIMTFIFNQDGQVYQRNLGEDTVKIASRMTEYNPDDSWTVVQDRGVTEE